MKKNLHILIVATVLLPVFYVAYSILSFNSMEIDEEEIDVNGVFGYEIPIAEIDTIILIDALPTLYPAGGFEVNKQLKGQFVRTSDHKMVQIISHHSDLYIKIITKDLDIFFYNAEGITETKMLFNQLSKL
ncbi:MAG: hypothetical protein N4A45_10045 [Flavobacteriales bacterium]|nr:hypothetical protein [Flavobacteriales bacterium]